MTRKVRRRGSDDRPPQDRPPRAPPHPGRARPRAGGGAGLSRPSRFPGSARLALSLTFDDARDSQLEVGVPILARYGLRATFFVLPNNVARRRAEWQSVVDVGHEVGNHTVTHPCSGNYAFSRTNALEDYSLERIGAEMDQASDAIERLLGVRPRSFAYPCGQSFVGRGSERTSYVPIVARRFAAGRGYGSEASNDPLRCDVAHLDAFTIDQLDAGELVGLVDREAAGRWVIMAGHDVGLGGEQTVLVESLTALAERCGRGDVWVAPVGHIAAALSGAG